MHVTLSKTCWTMLTLLGILREEADYDTFNSK